MTKQQPKPRTLTTGRNTLGIHIGPGADQARADIETLRNHYSRNGFNPPTAAGIVRVVLRQAVERIERGGDE